MLGSIAHAIFVARAPFLAHEQSWSGRNYSVQDSQGSRGTIAFGTDDDEFVAVFYLHTSPRNPLAYGRAIPPLELPVHDVPGELAPLAREAMQYVLQDVDGKACPVLTSAFWSNPKTDSIASGEPWADALEHGACLVARQMLPADVAMEQWATDFGFSQSQTALTEALFLRRISARQAVELTACECDQIAAIATSEQGLSMCRESLAEAGIIAR